ncbi:MAG: DotU family type IV/VI secretion system protein [Alphaproteobacteria bacterium]|nr:DotU family type IV/VI secretion system protein [Alphaproteobacteria bacterium]
MARFKSDKERSSYIIECFEQFYGEVLKHKQFALSKSSKKISTDATSSPNATAEFILSKLKVVIKEQARGAGYAGSTFSENYFNEAQFIMVALADEVFLNLDWEGKTYWESNLLEQTIYGTHSAGQVFFEKLDALLKEQSPIQKELGVLYLNALGLGFQGKYRHFSDSAILHDYRFRLFTYINRREPYLFKQHIHLFPDAYSHTLEANAPKQLATMRNWYFLIGGLVFIYLIISYIIWYAATSEIKTVINKILTFAEATT